MDIQYHSATAQYPNVESYATQFATQLKRTCAVIINGKPLIPSNNDSKLEFQKKWLAVPLSFHQHNSFDCHLIPGTGTYIVNLGGKVRFDESGRNRLGESADLIEDASTQKRPVWGSYFGFNVTLVVDESIVSNNNVDVISSFNYRFTYRPEDSVIQV